MIPGNMKTPIPNLKHDSRPLYIQVSDALSQLILNNTYVIGEKLPSEEDLSIQLGVSRPTLRVAIGYLESQGMLIRRHGVGTFIADPRGTQPGSEGLEVIETVCELADRKGLTYERVEWQLERIRTDEKIADLLKTSVNVPAIFIRYGFKLSGKPFGFFDSWIPESYVDYEKLKAYPQKGLLDYLYECCPEKLTSTQTTLLATVADEAISRRTGFPAGSPLLHLEELFILENGLPFVYTLKYFDTSVMYFYMSRRFPHRPGLVNGKH